MPRERGVSTVLDVSLFLLLVSASVLSVVTAVSPESPPAVADDEATVETLATTTATVRYELGVERETGDSVERVTHGTLAELLAEATLAALAVDGRPLSPYGTGFTQAVGDAVRSVLDGRTQVVTTWRPFDGSALSGRLVVGPSPPPEATVHAATLRVDSNVRPPSSPTATATAGGYGALADVTARHTVDGLFPARETHVARDGAAADATVARTEFETVRAAYGSPTPLADGTTPARDALVEAVSNRTASRFRERFETPRAAASALRLDRVTVVVRTWS